jgi:hypothetical protein
VPVSLPDPAVVSRPVSSAGQLTLEIAVGLTVAVLAVVAVRIRARWHTWMGAVVLLATLLGSGVEVIFNTAADFWYYQPHQVAGVSTWDRSVPLWALGSYVPFYGGLGLLGWLLLEKGATRRRLAAYAVGLWVFAVVTEVGLVGIHVYQYYGPQPYRIGNFPVWISAANAAICTTVAVGAARLSRRLHGPAQWLLVVLGPPVVSAFLLGTTFPMVIALQASDPSTAASYAAGAVSTALAVAVCALVLRLVPVSGLPDSLRQQPQAADQKAASKTRPKVGPSRREPSIDAATAPLPTVSA